MAKKTDNFAFLFYDISPRIEYWFNESVGERKNE